MKVLVAVLVCALVATHGYEYVEVVTNGNHSVAVTVNTTHILLRGTLPPKIPGVVSPTRSIKLPLLYNQIVVNNVTSIGNTYFPFMDIYCFQPLSSLSILSLNWKLTNGTVHCAHQLASWQMDVRNAGSVANEINVVIAVDFMYTTEADDDGTNVTSTYCKRIHKLHHKHHHKKFGCFLGGMLTMAIGMCLVRCGVRCCQRRRMQRALAQQMYATPLLPSQYPQHTAIPGHVSPYVSQKYTYPTLQSNVICSGSPM